MAIVTVNKNGVEQSSLVWITKSKVKGRVSGYDIMLSVVRGSGAEAGVRDRATVHFYNKCAEQISTTGYIVFAIDGDLLYMKEADSRAGFKACASKGTAGTNFCQVQDPFLVGWVSKRRGNYQLFQDSTSGIYYIEGKELKV